MPRKSSLKTFSLIPTLAFCLTIAKRRFFASALPRGMRKKLVRAARPKAIREAASTGAAIWWRLSPQAFKTVNSLSRDRRPIPIRIAMMSARGIVNSISAGMR
ncbi:MAG: hypothetical protein A4E73_01088 [Syntrophaceae bacterium PtaU1.Bin231]|nr:MAG: hypothetical protein A4E73_01088 [Syntrophaceae bacterium PtaU1.Bin231]